MPCLMDAEGKGFNRSLVEHTNKTNSLFFRLDTICIFTHIL